MQDNCYATFNKVFCFKRHLLEIHCREETNVSNCHGEVHAIVAGTGQPEMPAVCNIEDSSGGDNDIGDMDLDEQIEEDMDVDVISDAIITFIATLKSYNSIPYSASNEIVNQVRELLKTVVMTLKKKTEKKLKAFQTELGWKDNQVQEILNCFQGMDLFAELSSEYKQIKYLKLKNALVLPEEKIIGQNFQSEVNRNDGVAMQVLKNDTYQYVPLSKLLKRILEQPGVMPLILQQCITPIPGEIATFLDGKLVKKQPPIGDNNCPEIKLLLYSDEFETANPLGSKKCMHKLCAFYINILNLPQDLQCNLNNIHLLALVKSAILSEYGMDTVLYQIKEDLHVLYEHGLELNCPDYAGIVKPKLFQVIGDNLGLHNMLGFAGSFSANYYCRFCKVHRMRAEILLQEECNLLRNKISYETDIAENNLSTTGLSRSSVLNELPYYHVLENASVDVMHDIFEGIAPLEVKLILKQLIDNGSFTLEEINERISSFSYGFTDKRNQPTLIHQNSLRNPSGSSGQTASQMMCLVFTLPLIIGDKVMVDSDVWELLLMLLDIIKLVMSRTVSEEETFHLSSLIRDHHGLYLRLFPDRHLIPKHHFLLHYPHCIRLLGPLQQYSSMRFEAKHKQLKLFAKVSNNFRNIAKTLAYKYQVAHGFSLLLKPHIRDTQSMAIYGQSVVDLDLCENGDYLQKMLGIPSNGDNHLLLSVNCVAFHSYEFRKGVIIVTGVKDSEPEFAQIDKLFVLEGKVVLLLDIWETQYFYRHYHAYAVLPSTEQKVMEFDKVDSNTTSNDCNAAFYVKPSSEDDITIEMGPPSTSMPDGTKVPHSPGSRTTDPVSSEESPSGESSSSASSDGFQPRIYFDVINILKLSARGQSVITSIRKDGLLTPSNRRILVASCVAELVLRFGHKPSSFQKESLAKAVVVAFPCLKDSRGRGHEAFYTKGTSGRPATVGWKSILNTVENE
ncbi:hypothetical protein BSL78_10692 [Apostichopus japonicus]|uniref:C2H2-type domain-containing protein n=1 Tax=Stichopus japonicus TaxID=307972 RepID=A0A2G8KWU3_STIJA|nr:hypothetical protein BSL78_10692 [Apostichopus japonicus]